MGHKASKVTKKDSSPEPKWTTEDLKEYKTFSQHFVMKKVLGNGADGVVTSYVDRNNGGAIAVKVPRSNTARQIATEIKNLQALGKHDNIAGMITSCADFYPIGPAIMLPLCDLGDLFRYKELWYEQQLTNGQEVRIPEVTVAKLMRDISLGLDFLNNGHDICYVHNDLKPENILALTPIDYTGGGIPTEPIFKITDFARVSMYPPSQNTFLYLGPWKGTYEYAPPIRERFHPIKPSVDIWGFGATIQMFALNILPTESREAVISRAIHNGRPHPHLMDNVAWQTTAWRSKRMVVYRPLNTGRTELKTNWDVHSSIRYHRPYSANLNAWYKAMMDSDAQARITAADLKKYAVPALEAHMATLREIASVDEGMSRLAIQ
jgi:serine/threonine protein kinase